MLHINKLSVSFGGTYLFNNISFKLSAGNRLGLIGKNGAGKSTLLKILAGDLTDFEGEIAKEKNINIGFLRQDIDFEEGRTVLEEAYQAFSSIVEIESKLDEINTQLAERTDYESESYNQLMIDLNEYQHQYEILGGYNYQGETERVLKGLGFTAEDFNAKTDTFSGGWRMRIELAKLLLQNNDILLLDEPTNHLDIESIMWIESFLVSFSGCVVIVSHDTMFLDNVTNRTIEISLGKIYDYNKPYSAFKELRKTIQEQQLAAQKNQQKEIKQTEKLIDKFRAKANKASMAQSLIKKLEKTDIIEVDQDDQSTMSVNFSISKNPGKVVVEAENLAKNFGNHQVFSDVNFTIERNAKIAFVGQNGQGKSTLAKAIVGDLDYDGQLKLGHNVEIGYFAQNQAEYLDPNKTVLDTMIDSANESNRSKVRDILGAFLFRGDDVSKYVKVLSGGERNRLALAKMILAPFNVLIMDEPTNHLDIQSKNVLKKALANFEGTLILVSHDRDFLQGLADTVYEFRNHKVKEFLGDINDYLKSRALENMRQVEQKTEEKTAVKSKNSPAKDYEIQKKYKKLSNKLSSIESNITKLEKEIAVIDQQMANNYDETVSQPDFFNNYKSLKSDLEKQMEHWEKVQIQLDDIK
ncbi:ABC-F family ATP-binding cassette domain-containing protein [Psychroflexus sp. ALD_RP9]|uniref:ABC-F family ATP-binding cassette domain-containing protein n=1 Tax=Psychroflexus sp. ALD_RP9 TaxID=2777186 RepID=UPI001A8DA1A2|nr:ABC-F family ATP-binding cassette domain-containing protein [Psychroflexus sp. ALD_RP9]QSS97701.1 ATP-binding cassette domain-containing protein [Psychroflexus sp. ALD_RP9]